MITAPSNFIYIREGERGNDGKRRLILRCVCGSEKSYDAYKIKTGATRSCGCLRNKHIGDGNRKHGYFGTPTYRSWAAMKRRCTDPNNNRYKYYGGRGIMVCNEWLDSFNCFLSDMGERPEGKTLDRINPDGHYCQENCRWATAKEQRNNRSNMDLGER